MKPPKSSIIIALGTPRGSSSQNNSAPDDLQDEDDNGTGDETDLKLEEPQDYPVLYLADLKNVAKSLQVGDEILIHAKVTEREDDNDGTDLEVECHTAEPARKSTTLPGLGDNRQKIDDNWNRAMGGE